MKPDQPILALALCMLAGVAALGADDRRKYETGPLTAEDFHGQAKEIPGAAAYTATQLGFEMRYRYKAAGTNFTVTLESITIDAHIRRDQSWNKDPGNLLLLDHEQGHADIAQIQCLKARLTFRDKLKGRGVAATAGSRKEAVVALDREVRKEMAIYERAAREADTEYDRETINGLGGTQAEWRRVQSETLKELADKWGRKK